MSGREGGKKKPLKAAKKEQKDVDEDAFNDDLAEFVEPKAKIQKIRNLNDSSVLANNKKCEVCGVQFTRLFSVLRHQRIVHPVWFYSQQKLQKRAETKEIKKHRCDMCSCSFTQSGSLSRHRKSAHGFNPTSIQKIPAAPLSSGVTTANASAKKYECHVCSKKFARAFKCRKHVQNIHNINLPYVRKLQCSECQSSFPSTTLFTEHFSHQHQDFSLKTEHLTFDASEEFKAWKLDMEKKTASVYVRNHRYMKKTSGSKIEIYGCHRSGHFKSQGKGKRQMKIQGSNKIGFFCPASIRVEISGETPKLKVTYCSSHVGHQCEVSRMRLSKPEKDEISSKFFAGVPTQHVLHSILETTKSITDSLVTLSGLEINATCQTECNERERNAVSNELNKKSKSLQAEARAAVLGFLENLEQFQTDEQCREIIQQISALTHKCKAMHCLSKKLHFKYCTHKKFPTAT